MAPAAAPAPTPAARAVAAAPAPTPAAPAAGAPATLGEGGYEAISGRPADAMAAARKSNLDLLFGARPLDLPEHTASTAAADAPGAGFPKAAPDEDVRDLVVSLREVLADGSLGADLAAGGPLPGELAGPATKADAISQLVPLPAVRTAPGAGAHAADDLYAKIRANKARDA